MGQGRQRPVFPAGLVLLGFVCVFVFASCGGGGGGGGLLGWLEASAQASPWMIVVVLAVATVTSEDLACVTAGVLAAKGTFPFLLAVTGCLTGIVLSDVGLFLLGKWCGERIIRYPPISWFVTARRLEIGKQLYRRYGGALVISSRFLPGTRMLAYIAAGMLGYPWKRFVVYMSLACSLWTPLVVGFSMKFGGAILQWLETYQRWAMLGFPVAVIVVWLVLKGFFRLTEALHQKGESD